MRPGKRNGTVGSSVLILLAPDFREGKTVYCLERLRQAGISVSLVGLSAGLIVGHNGMTIRPDVTLGHLPESVGHRLVLIPDGKGCVSALFADPRVHQLIEATVDNQGFVAAMPEAEVMLEQTGIITSESASRYVYQADQGLEDFVTQMINSIE